MAPGESPSTKGSFSVSGTSGVGNVRPMSSKVTRDGRAGEKAKMVKALDFFCGAGGLTRGLLDAGVDVLAGIDNDSRLERTYEKNNTPSKFEGCAIAEVDIHALRKKYGVGDEDVVLYAGCTPCQPFSSLNQRRKAPKDGRERLLLSFAEVIKAAPPDFVVVENVPGLGNRYYGGDIFDEFLGVLKDLGFKAPDSKPLDAQDYGVPQVRKRFLLVASRHVDMKLPEPTGERTTVRDAIGGWPSPALGSTRKRVRSIDTAFGPDGTEPDPEWPNHVTRILMEEHLAILNAIPRDGGKRSDVPDASILLACHQKAPKLHKDVFGRMAWDQPAPTLTSRCTDVYCGRFAHPDEPRGLSLREAAAIQTFPPDYRFYGTFSHAAAQIGNAVPPKLAWYLGHAVVNAAEEASLL